MKFLLEGVDVRGRAISEVVEHDGGAGSVLSKLAYRALPTVRALDDGPIPGTCTIGVTLESSGPPPREATPEEVARLRERPCDACGQRVWTKRGRPCMCRPCALRAGLIVYFDDPMPEITEAHVEQAKALHASGGCAPYPFAGKRKAFIPGQTELATMHRAALDHPLSPSEDLPDAACLLTDRQLEHLSRIPPRTVDELRVALAKEFEESERLRERISEQSRNITALELGLGERARDLGAALDRARLLEVKLQTAEMSRDHASSMHAATCKKLRRVEQEYEFMLRRLLPDPFESLTRQALGPLVVAGGSSRFEGWADGDVLAWWEKQRLRLSPEEFEVLKSAVYRHESNSPGREEPSA